MKILVTGATGYIGGKLAAQLVAEGHEVHALVRPTSAAEAVPEGVTAHTHDATSRGAMNLLSAISPQRVFHLAACQVLNPTCERVDELLTANVVLGCQIAEASSTVGVDAFVSAASFWQRYDDESVPGFQPANLYTATKQAFGDLLRYYVQMRNLPAIELELPDTYGPSDPRNKILSLFAQAQASGQPLGMSPGEQRLDMVHVDDVARGFVAAADLITAEPHLAGSLYALHADEPVRLRDLVSLWERTSGVPVPVEFGARPYRPREMMEPSATPILPGWTPTMTLTDGLRELAVHGKLT